MAALIPAIFSSASVVCLGVYHLVCAIRSYLNGRPQDYTAKPCHPLQVSTHRIVKNIPVYLLTSGLFIAFVHQVSIFNDYNPLLKGHTPVHHFTSLQSAAVLFMFFTVSSFILVSHESTLFSTPPDLLFALTSVAFLLQYWASSASAAMQTSNLEAKFRSISGHISAFSSLFCFVIALQPRIFVADVLLGASIFAQGMWGLQTSLSLYVDAFIPDGCHRMLDVITGVESSTRCDLEDSKLRAVAILDFLLAVHVAFTFLITIAIYALLAKNTGGIGRHPSYEILSTAADSGLVQMKTLSGTQE